MATITAAVSSLQGISALAKKWIWETLTSVNLDGSPVAVAEAGVSLTVQAIGTFGGTSIAMQGSNDGTNWFPLPNHAGVAMVFTSAGGASTSYLPLYVRPLLTGGSGVDVDVSVLVR
jgi:hypothetical protein